MNGSAYSVASVKRMVSAVENNTKAMFTVVDKLRKCNKKLRGINRAINIMTEKIEGKGNE